MRQSAAAASPENIPKMQVPGKSAAVGQYFNVCSDRAISFDGIVKALAKAAGKEAKIVHYDVEAAGLKKGEGFPFRCCATSGPFADDCKH